MSELLQALVDAAAGLITAENYNPRGDNADRIQAVRNALAEYRTAHPDAEINLDELERTALARFEELRTATGHSPDALAALGAVVDVVDAVDAEITAVTTTQQGMDALSDRITSRPARPEPAAPNPADGQQQPADPATGAAPTEPAAPAPAQGQTPTTVQPAQPAAPAAPAPPAPTAPPAAPAPATAPEGTAPTTTPATEPAPVPATVAAATGRIPATTQPRVPLGALPNDEGQRDDGGYTLTAAADIPGIPMGAELDGLAGLTRAVMGRMQALDRAGVDTTAGIATIQREQPDERLVASGRGNDWDVVEYATDERRLPGGSLVAAGFDQGGGWCARPQRVYDDFCPVAVVDGLVDLPSVTAPRGSLSWPTSPDFSAIYTQTGFYMPIEEMNKPGGPGAPGSPGVRRDKPCYVVECNTDLDIVTEPYGICVKVPILMQRAYPELVSKTLENIIAAHAHKLNAVRIARMEELATKMTLARPNNGAPNATTGLLGTVELQVQWYRYRYRLGLNATLESVFPAFVHGILRSDLAKRNGVDTLDVTDAQLDSYLRSRGIAPQYVLDWQDAFAGPRDMAPDGTWLPTFDNTWNGAAPPPTPPTAAELGNPALGRPWGGNYPPVRWPETIRFLLYPAGSYVQATTDIISIDGLYDTALLARNLHLAVFTEEAFQIELKGCYQPLAITVPLCPSGFTAGTTTDQVCDAA